jgi:inorganic pyrophosphatase
VITKDTIYNNLDDIGRLPGLLIDRLKHYFLTYKQAPEDKQQACELLRVYGRDEACEVIRRCQADYAARFAGVLTAKA